MEKPLTKDAKKYQIFREIMNSKNLFIRILRKIGARKIILNEINKLETKFRTRDGYKFPEGSSGSFGEDTPGKWMNINEMKDVCSYYLDLFSKDIESIFWIKGLHYSFWTDFHATKD